LSQIHVSRLLRAALERLRSALEDAGPLAGSVGKA
jgi:DNA-directed RNA polymerase specialized sigma subunit